MKTRQKWVFVSIAVFLVASILYFHFPTPEKTIKTFLKFYYTMSSQEGNHLLNQEDIRNTRYDAYFLGNLKDYIVEDRIEKLVSIGILTIPSRYVLNGILSVDLQDIQIHCIEKDEHQYVYQAKAYVVYQNETSEVIEVSGRVKLLKEDHRWKVSSFKEDKYVV